MSEIYHEGRRHLQDQFDIRRLADRPEERIVHDRLTPDWKKTDWAADVLPANDPARRTAQP